MKKQLNARVSKEIFQMKNELVEHISKKYEEQGIPAKVTVDYIVEQSIKLLHQVVVQGTAEIEYIQKRENEK